MTLHRVISSNRMNNATRLNRVRQLLNQGVNINELNRNGYTPITQAAWKGQTNIARLLINRGANLARGLLPPLVQAVRQGHYAIAHSLIVAGANVNTRRNPSDMTPLMWAAYQGNANMARLLVEAGADLNAHTDTGVTALVFAAVNDHRNVVRVLVEAGANLNTYRTASGMTPLMWAVIHGNTNLVRLMIRKGANVNARNRNGHTARNVANNATRTALNTPWRPKRLTNLLYRRETGIKSRPT